MPDPTVFGGVVLEHDCEQCKGVNSRDCQHCDRGRVRTKDGVTLIQFIRDNLDLIHPEPDPFSDA